MAAKMAAVGYAASLPITEERSLFEFETPMPRPGARDLLVRIKAVSVNPIDVKVRMRKGGSQAEPIVLGWDAAGIVEAVGRDCSLFRAGDHVYYAGNINRAGTNAAFHLVDEASSGASLLRSASRKPPPCRSPPSRRGSYCSTALASSAARGWSAARCWSSAARVVSARLPSSSRAN
jgi:Alcohol dehydrogenase GroES-like domain